MSVRWFRQTDAVAQRALRQAGVIPWNPPLEGDALVDEMHELAIAEWVERESSAAESHPRHRGA